MPSTGTVAQLIHPVSITVAGAAPALDESVPDFPFQPFFPAGSSLTARALERSPHAAQSLPQRAAPRQGPPRRRRAWHDLRPVEEADHPVGTSRIVSAVEWAGYLGVAPLIVCLAAVGLLPGYAGRELAQHAAIAWGALLLAFAGAVHFGLTLGGVLRFGPVRLGAALTPLPIAAGALLLGGQRALALLVVGHGCLWLYEHRVLGTALPPFYLGLRRQLAFATCMLLALTMFVSDSGGLS
jgi:hypothetical protein